MPDRLWHTDADLQQRTFPVPGVKLFGVVEPLRPHGGATLAIAGSHRAVDRYRPALVRARGSTMSSQWTGFMRHDPWLQVLATADRPAAATAALLDGVHDADGVPLEVVELTGQPGDVWVTHLHTFHCVAPNALDTPRMAVAATVGRRPPGPR